MSLEDILMSILVEVPLPSVGVEITKITMGKEIKIPGVDERTWYLASLPQIQVDVRGKEILVEKDPVKGDPVKEQIMLILADIEYLVNLRKKVIDEVEQFFYSFILKRLSNLKIDESYYAKEELVLTWAEAESIGVALQRKVYILMKYREMLLRKFLEARKMNFVPGVGDSAVDLKILDRLSDIHSFVLEELKMETQAHGLSWKNTCCSKIFEGLPRDRGAVIARTNTNTPSRCWIRTMLFVDGVWAVEPCADHWVNIPRPVVQNEVPRQRSYDDTLPPMSEFFKLMKKRWDDVFLEAIEFVGSRRLLPVGSVNFCRALSVVEPVSSFDYRRPTAFSLRVSQFCTIFIHYSLFSRLSTEDITDFVASMASARTALRNVQIIQTSGSIASSVQSYFASAVSSHIPSVAQRISLSARLDESQSDIISKLHTIEKGLLDSLPQQEEAFRTLIQGARQEGRTIDDVQTSVSSGGSGSGGGVTCGQCRGRHMTSKCHRVQGLCHNCGQPGHFSRVCPAGGQSVNQSQQGSAGGSSQQRQPQFPGPQQAQVNALLSEQAAEMPERIIADIECLVQLRKKVIDEFEKFFYSFSLKRLSNLKIDESYLAKEELLLTWVEAESTGVALNRKRYILLKYREMLLRKEQAIAHGLTWKTTCCSKVFEGHTRDRGAVIARTNTNTPSTCWIRTMVFVDGVWAIEPCSDHWVNIPRPVVQNEVPRQRSYDDTLPPVDVLKQLWPFGSVKISGIVYSKVSYSGRSIVGSLGHSYLSNPDESYSITSRWVFRRRDIDSDVEFIM
ncbi:cell nucleic acid-binding protein [Dorcoceras hygrometricum]|uniref:Cell nucleic acid-binding protein n=1 Tax=Dorcoceras hygrometricum TaxID=472368 RepID=A0A2Z7APC9_9LAMI|nr:cell nucleic acid-binding protein [Dorcoceras hygrometricum]